MMVKPFESKLFDPYRHSIVSQETQTKSDGVLKHHLGHQTIVSHSQSSKRIDNPSEKIADLQSEPLPITGFSRVGRVVLTMRIEEGFRPHLPKPKTFQKGL